MRANVTLADASDYFARFTLQTDIKALIDDPRLPRESGEVLQTDSVLTLKLESLQQQSRYLFLCLSAEEAIGLWQEFAQTLEVASPNSFRLSEIESGIPSLYPETSEEFVLQMANLGMLDAVSFKKGCYPGQEIVARMQYLGKLKRRMFLAELDTGELPRPGDHLVAEGKTEIDGSGMVVDAQFDQRGVCQCLYVAQIARAEAGNLRLLSQPQVLIQNRELPYPISAST